MISPNPEGNLIAKWGVETIAPSLFKDGHPRKMLYESVGIHNEVSNFYGPAY